VRRALAHALERAGIAVEVAEGDEVAGLPEGELLEHELLERLGLPSLVVVADPLLVPWRPCFVDTPDGVLVRHGAGACGSMPDWVGRVVFAADAPSSPETLHAFRVAPSVPAAAERHACLALVARVGAGRVRLALDHAEGLDAAALRERVLALVAEALPQHLPLLATVCRWHELGIDPLVECWAGNALAERNSDLIVNLVP
jgi:hypothetical protein